jgi:hypothetical protein
MVMMGLGLQPELERSQERKKIRLLKLLQELWLMVLGLLKE